MTDKRAIKEILKYYYNLKKQYDYYMQNNMNTDFADGELCAIRCILVLVYGFDGKDERF